MGSRVIDFTGSRLFFSILCGIPWAIPIVPAEPLEQTLTLTHEIPWHAVRFRGNSCNFYSGAPREIPWDAPCAPTTRPAGCQSDHSTD